MQLSVRKREAAGMLFFAACIAGADQLIKHLIEKSPIGATIAQYPPVFEIIRSENHGAAFSMLAGERRFLLISTSVMLALLFLVILFYPRLTKEARWAASALLGGGAGNWLDRFTSGTVSDYIRLLFVDFPVFNLADIVITLSVSCLIILLVIGRIEELKEKEHGSGH